MQVDATLKAILESLASCIIPKLTGLRPVESLKTELVSVRRRMPDLVVRLEDGSILHLEVQSTNDRRMPRRMLECWLMLSGKYPPASLRQAVLYVGYQPLSMADGLDYPRLTFSYPMKDIREFDADEILASPLPSERALALLCGSAERAARYRGFSKPGPGSAYRIGGVFSTRS